MITKWRINRLINSLKKETAIEAKMIAEQWKMRKFVMINNRIQEVFPDIYNGALNNVSRRIYIHHIPHTTVDFLMNVLLKISEDAEAVAVEFDQFESGYNVEVEIYLRQTGSEDIVSSVFDVQNAPGCVKRP